MLQRDQRSSQRISTISAFVDISLPSAVDPSVLETFTVRVETYLGIHDYIFVLLTGRWRYEMAARGYGYYSRKQ